LIDAAGARVVAARAVVNATGPWVSRFVRDASPLSTAHTVRLVKGSHIVVPRLFAHRFAYIFQNTDRRIVFAIPYEHEFTLIGTTDIEYHGEPAACGIEAAEVDYLCAIVNRYFRQQIGPPMFCGATPACGRSSRMSLQIRRPSRATMHLRSTAPCRADAVGIWRQDHNLSAPRRAGRRHAGRALGLSRRAVDAPRDPAGGDLPEGSFAAFLRVVERRYGWLPPALRVRYASAYGTAIHRLLGSAAALADLGPEILPGLYEREAEYLCREEWAVSAADILWRRTKLGLHAPPASAQRLEDWLARR
jgi:glycerol-3-phosphate dehydrogenase